MSSKTRINYTLSKKKNKSVMEHNFRIIPQETQQGPQFLRASPATNSIGSISKPKTDVKSKLSNFLGYNFFLRANLRNGSWHLNWLVVRLLLL
jgi:hypothetical protein